MSRIYPLETLRRRLFLVIAGVVAATGIGVGAVCLWLLSDLGLDAVGVVIAALPIFVLGGSALVIVAATRRVRLELSEHGVALHLPGATAEADWADVESIGRVWLGSLSGDALTLRRRARVQRASWFALLVPFDLSQLMAIPLAPFALPLHGSRLEADLRSRLPGLTSDGALISG